MYGPGAGQGSSGPPPSSGGGPRERTFTPRGQMSAGANSRPPLSDLPPNMRMMFEPRPPLVFAKHPEKRPNSAYTGISQFLQAFEHEKPMERETFETPIERKRRQAEELERLNKEKNDLVAAQWDPNNNPKATGNAYNTLFVGRLSFDITDKKLKRDMEQYGPVKSVRLVTDLEGKSRGYAFVEFEKDADMNAAFKRADGKKLEGRRIVVDVERGRTVRNWRPRRLGGGLGGRKAVKGKKQVADEARAAQTAERKAGAFGSAAKPQNDYDSNRGGYSASTPVSRPGLGAERDSRDNRDRDRDRSDRDRRDRDYRDRDRGADSRSGGGSYHGDSKYGPGPSSAGSSRNSGGSSSRRSRSRDRDRDSYYGGGSARAPHDHGEDKSPRSSGFYGAGSGYGQGYGYASGPASGSGADRRRRSRSR